MKRMLITAAVLTALLGGALPSLGQHAEAAPADDTAANAATTDARRTSETVRTALDAYRGLTGAYVFQTHLGVGMVAELAANKVYTTEQAAATLTRMTGGMEALRLLIGEMAGQDLPAADRDLIAEMLAVADGVEAEAEALAKYLRSGQQADADAYRGQRQKTATAIHAFLGIG